jgi:hypothetical protein
MKPTRNTEATLVDLLERILDKGLVLHADIIIHVAGIPLLGLSLKACIAGMGTMLRYGIWQDWDEAQRIAAATESRQKKRVSWRPEEEILLKTFASCWMDDGIYRSWRPGNLYVTDTKILLLRSEPYEILFQCFFNDIRYINIKEDHDVMGAGTEILEISLYSGREARLHSLNTRAVEAIIRDRLPASIMEPSGIGKGETL